MTADDGLDGALADGARTWPPGRALSPAESCAATCQDCGAPWRVHCSMRGFRLRCGCGGWVAVPAASGDDAPKSLADANPPALRQEDGATALLPSMRQDADGLLHPRIERGDVYDAPIPTSLPMAPGALQAGRAEWRARWTNVALLEVLAVLAAILAPQIAVVVFAAGREAMLLMPFASMLGGVAVLLIAANSGPYAKAGMRRPAARHLAEALVAPAVGLAFAAGWLEVLHQAMPHLADHSLIDELRSRLGLGLAIFTIAVVPAIVEEVAFRGMLQGRLMALLGARQGLVVTAMAFTLVHMSPATMPIHLGLGLYLGWLRERSGSLWPGILVHFAYNALVVCLLR
jgi:membrane protease YdiL (CAAX protease family)